MSTERKPQQPEDEPRMEKQKMDEPQEEFVGDMARPSRDISETNRRAPAPAQPEPHAASAPAKR